MEFFEVKTVEEVFGTFEYFGTTPTEEVPIEEAVGRVLAEPLSSEEDFPPFCRSTMDGYALRATDTFGASPSSPVPFRVVGEVKMGEPPAFGIGPGEAALIPTGGMLPEGADAVVMLEYTRHLGPQEVEVLRPASPWENVMRPGEDFRRGEVLLQKGRRLRPQDLGICATLGHGHLKVFKRPRVGIISTGDEIVPLDRIPQPGQVRNSNSYVLMGLMLKEGGDPLYLGHCRDELKELLGALRKGIRQGCDMILVSGGSSVGTRDLTLSAFEELGAEVLVHGVAISPGKPTLLARKGDLPIWGLPGHPASCAIVAMVLVVPLLRRISGEVPFLPPFRWWLRARAKRNIPSVPGREDYVRVKIRREGEGVWVEPIFAKSGALFPLVKGDALLRIELESEGVGAGEEVTVFPL